MTSMASERSALYYYIVIKYYNFAQLKKIIEILETQQKDKLHNTVSDVLSRVHKDFFMLSFGQTLPIQVSILYDDDPSMRDTEKEIEAFLQDQPNHSISQSEKENFENDESEVYVQKLKDFLREQ